MSAAVLAFRPQPQPETAPADPRTDFDYAYAMADLDARELAWLTEGFIAAWGRHDLPTQLDCLKRKAAIMGVAYPTRLSRPDRRDDDQKDFDEYCDEQGVVAAVMARG